jgi:hypothetical protein
MRIRMLAAFGCVLATAAGIVQRGWAEPTPAAGRAAVASSLAHSATQCREWVDAKDYKSLAQTAGGMKLLAQVLQGKSQGDDWQRATAAAISAAEELHAAAQGENAVAAGAALDRAATAIQAVQAMAAAASDPGGSEAAPIGGNLRQLMMLMDNLRGQAKIALLTGDASGAKRAALTLAELGPLLHRGKSGEDWEVMAHDFTQAAQAAGSAEEADTKRLKPLFKTMSQACDHCHDSR